MSRVKRYRTDDGRSLVPMRLRFYHYNLQIVFAICLVIALLTLVLDKELSINLLTEIGGVALTVFVINNILDRKERQKRISIDQRILRELQYIIASYYSIWKHVYWEYAPELKLNSESDFINAYPELIKRTKITTQFEVVSIQHPESWELFFYNRIIKDCFENYHSTLIKSIQTFINDFKIYIEPELLDILLSILESQYLRDLIVMNQDATASYIVELEQDPDKLESFLKPESIKHIDHIVALSIYSKTLYSVIEQFRKVDVELYQIKKYFIHPSKQFGR